MTEPVTIDLRPGHFSFVGKDERRSVQQIAIAYQIAGYEHNWIENAIGGTSDDRLIGNDAVNRLEGNAGNDTLEGGKGDDILVGSAGFDTYVHRSGDGSDRIVETREADGTFHGLIRIESTVSDQLATGYFKPVDDQPDTYTSADDLTLIRGATWQLQTPDGASIDLGADFQSGDLGIRLGAAPPTTHTQLSGGETGNYLSGTSTSSVRVDGLDGKDMIWGSAEADVLNGGEGNDWIVGDGGADHIDGGPGDDYITGFGDGIDRISDFAELGRTAYRLATLWASAPGSSQPTSGWVWARWRSICRTAARSISRASMPATRSLSNSLSEKLITVPKSRPRKFGHPLK